MTSSRFVRKQSYPRRLGVPVSRRASSSANEAAKGVVSYATSEKPKGSRGRNLKAITSGTLCRCAGFQKVFCWQQIVEGERRRRVEHKALQQQLRRA
jgi:hypothetical protein